MSKEDRRSIYKTSKRIEALHPDEKNNILLVLNIDPASLQLKTEFEFKNECATAEAAMTMHRYHQQRLLLNYEKIKDFLNKTKRRAGMGSCIYLTKEASRIIGHQGISD